MQKRFPAIGVCLVFPLLIGCSSKSEETGEIKTTAPINNNSLEAKSAPVAPTDPSIQYPGDNKGKKGQ